MLVPNGIRWDKEAEVVVVGYGFAGAVAAITARDKTDSVMILEKQGADSHYSNSSMSGGFIIRPSDVNKGIEYMKALCQVDESPHWTDIDTIRVWAEYTAQNKDWLENLGGRIKFISKAAEYPQLPGADGIEIWQYLGIGWQMMKFMYEQVNSRQIEVWYQTLAQRLLTNEKGEVIGVRAISARNGQQDEVNIKARKAVILCSGGFEGNEEMKLQYLRVYPIYFTGGSVNMGEGITMAQEVGAALWHMNCCSGRLILKFHDYPVAFSLNPSGRAFGKHMFRSLSEKAPAGLIIVDKYGRRYMSENFKAHAAWYQLTTYDANRLEYPRVPSYCIFDRRRMEHSPLVLISGAAGRYQNYKWSRDNKAELKRGWIIHSDTIAELAARIGIPGKTLNKTVRIWNKHCEEGKDSEFGRNPMELIPLDSPPFYAVKLFPGGPNTQGGPRRNSRAQVVNPFGNSIPGLYAAGECGSIYGMLYPAAGSNLAECIAFGRIAGENAVFEAEKA
jgi:succinate dehydrogenase/fumarate reductase flavoprotein subunit